MRVSGDSHAAHVWLSTIDQRNLLARQDDVPMQAAGGQAPLEIKVDGRQRFQEMEGFGASMTDSSAYLMRSLRPEARREVNERLFGRDGIHVSMLRQPMGACDYNLDVYSYDDVKGDDSLKHFSVDKDRRRMLPALHEAMGVNPNLKVIATPWSAPGWMKTSGSPIGGKLKKNSYRTYGEYFAKFIEAYRGEGIPIYAVTAQNEPLYTPKNYPGMSMSAREEADFIKQGLGPALDRHKLDTKIIAYDHNWDRPDFPLQVLEDREAAKYVDGVAWHAYGGRHSAMSAVHDAHPDKGMWFTEASGGEWVPAFHDAFMDQMGHVIRAPRNHANSVVWWNVALDPQHGPSLLDKSTCRGLVTIDPASGHVDYNVDYYTMGHVSKFVEPGAVRIGSTSYDGKLEDVAFENPDGSKVLVVSNRTKKAQTFHVTDGGESFDYTLPGEAAATFTWDGNSPG